MKREEKFREKSGKIGSDINFSPTDTLKDINFLNQKKNEIFLKFDSYSQMSILKQMALDVGLL